MKKLIYISFLLSSTCFGQDLVKEWELAASRVLRGEILYEFSVLDPGLTEAQKATTYDCLRESVKPVEILQKGKYIVFYTFANNEEELMKMCFSLPIESLESKKLTYTQAEQIYISK